MFKKGEKKLYHDMCMSELVSDIKGLQIVLKKVVQQNHMHFDKNYGQFDKKKVLDLDNLDSESDPDSDGFDYEHKIGEQIMGHHHTEFHEEATNTSQMALNMTKGDIGINLT